MDVARRSLGTRRIGHGGTLDPFATGLLVLLVGRATRLLPYVPGEPKVYEATIRFGAETSTDDLTGEVVREAPPPDPARVDRAIETLTGAIEQLPPAYSAKQVDGRRAHAAARRGEPLELRPVGVTVHSWEPRARTPDQLDATITCGGGTYVRALARDLGRRSESAAHLVALRRTRSGPFDVAQAASLDDLRAGRASVRPAREAIGDLPTQPIDADGVARIARGQAVEATVEGERAALLDADGNVVAIAERIDGRWQPRVVLRDG